MNAPNIRADYEIDSVSFSIIATHPLPPSSPKAFKARNAQYEQFEALRNDFAKHLILMGDLNNTPWSPHFMKLMEKMNLKDSRQGFGRQNSWPNWLPVGRIPIDHILISPEIQVISRYLGPNCGSDHFPVLAEFEIYAP